MLIAELKQNVGVEGTVTGLLTEVHVSENSFGNRWMDLAVTDKSGSTTLKMWAEALENNADPEAMVGKIISASGMADLWQDRGTLNVVKIQESFSASLRDVFPALAEEDAAQCKEELVSLLEKVVDTRIKKLLQTIFSAKRLEKMSEKTGGTNHHVFLGGLLLHLVQTAKISLAGANTAGPYAKPVNEDYLIAGALLHDIGKITTLSDEPGKLSDRGFCIDAGTESVLYVTMYNNKLGEDKVPNLATLNHIILACHNGGPRTLEAIIVSNADCLDTQVDSFGLAFTGNTKNGGKIAYSKKMGAYMFREGSGETE